MCYFCLLYFMTSSFFRMHSWTSFQTSASTSTQYLCQTSCMSLSLACGRQHSPISSASYTQPGMMLCSSSMPGKLCYVLSLYYLTYQTIRFQLVPTFRCDTIQRFSANVSGLTKLTARDFEDILQVCITPMDFLLWFSLSP